MNNQISIFRAVFLIFSFSLFTYISHQIVRHADFTSFESLLCILWIFLNVALFAIQPLYFWAKEGLRGTRAELILTRLGYFSLSYLNYLLVLVVLRDSIGFVLDILDRPNFAYDRFEAQVILVLPILFLFLGQLSLKLGPRIFKVSIHHDTVSAPMHGFKILQISDLHIGQMISEDYVKRVVFLTNQQEPDMVVLTGDIVDGHPEMHLSKIKLLAELKSKYGTFYVSGNHEYYWNFSEITRHIKDQGIEVLNNSAKHFHSLGLSVHGVTDLHAAFLNHEKPNLDQAMTETPAHHFKILLSHQSKLKEKARLAGIHLQLSGHTHGGQFFPWNFLIYLFDRYNKGLYDLGDLKLYVNQGTGFWGPPDRLGTLAEITELTLHKK